MDERQTNARLLSLSVQFPPRRVTNDRWREHHPEMVANLEELALGRVWSDAEGNEATRKFDAAMRPFLEDPFRGAKERRWFEPGESALALERQAALAALAAAGLDVGDVDLCIVGAFPPAHLDVGDAAYLARSLLLTCPAWNLEATCASTLIALQTAKAIVCAGDARRVLVVTSCAYSRPAPSEEVVSIANGDGVCAMVVGQSETSGFLGSYTVNTAGTCDALSYELDLDREGRPCVRMRLHRAAGRLIREATERCFTECVEGVLARTGLSVDDIDFFSFNASAAWLVPFYTSLLGIEPQKTIDTHRWFANTGPVLVPTGLFYGAHAGQLREGARVLVFGIGNTSNATAMILRWTGVALAPVQTPIELP